jgi:hypothetical protein
MRAHTLLAAILLLVVFAAYSQAAEQLHSYRPPLGYVPDAATAIRIAVAVWGPIYGNGVIAAEEPYVATLRGDVWTVMGTLNCKGNCDGGVAVAEISKLDGTILRVSHGK